MKLGTQSSTMLLVLLATVSLLLGTVDSFVQQQQLMHNMASSSLSVNRIVVAKNTLSKSSTALQERRWNFNEGQGPWGLKKNAEIWNGRMAQVRLGVATRPNAIFGIFCKPHISPNNCMCTDSYYSTCAHVFI